MTGEKSLIGAPRMAMPDRLVMFERKSSDATGVSQMFKCSKFDAAARAERFVVELEEKMPNDRNGR